MANIVEMDGDIFESGAEALVNTVNCVGVMGKGLALEFKKRFPKNFKAYRDVCAEGLLHTGKSFVFMNRMYDAHATTPRYIINFPTKQDWRDPSEYAYIAFGLNDLEAKIRNYGITSIAIPALGCGLGGLDWIKVKQLIIAKMCQIECVTVYLYGPKIERE
jgi:O-acetyl-ADP-ribose deacetylase (regulator of RNase III)